MLWEKGKQKTLYGKLSEARAEGENVRLNGLGSTVFSPSGKGALVVSSVFDDAYSLGYLDFSKPGELERVQLKGVKHKGVGELVEAAHLNKDRYLLLFNIDGCSWAYEGVFNEKKRPMTLAHVLVGARPLDGGMLERVHYDSKDDLFTFSFSTATSPTQIYTVGGKMRNVVTLHTSEKILGIPDVIAQQVKIEERFFDVMSEDDHPWHEYVSAEGTTDPTFDPVPEKKRDITKFLKELEDAHHTGWDETQVRDDLIQQIEKERQELKRWLDTRGDGTP